MYVEQTGAAKWEHKSFVVQEEGDIDKTCGGGLSMINEPFDKIVENNSIAERQLQQSKRHSTSVE